GDGELRLCASPRSRAEVSSWTAPLGANEPLRLEWSGSGIGDPGSGSKGRTPRLPAVGNASVVRLPLLAVVGSTNLGQGEVSPRPPLCRFCCAKSWLEDQNRVFLHGLPRSPGSDSDHRVI